MKPWDGTIVTFRDKSGWVTSDEWAALAEAGWSLVYDRRIGAAKMTPKDALFFSRTDNWDAAIAAFTAALKERDEYFICHRGARGSPGWEFIELRGGPDVPRTRAQYQSMFLVPGRIPRGYEFSGSRPFVGSPVAA